MKKMGVVLIMMICLSVTLTTAGSQSVEKIQQITDIKIVEVEGNLYFKIIYQYETENSFRLERKSDLKTGPWQPMPPGSIYKVFIPNSGTITWLITLDKLPDINFFRVKTT